jgi:hypothetical protein
LIFSTSGEQCLPSLTTALDLFSTSPTCSISFDLETHRDDECPHFFTSVFVAFVRLFPELFEGGRDIKAEHAIAEK